MHKSLVSNRKIISAVQLPAPDSIRKSFPLTETSTQNVVNSRKIIRDILNGADDRLLVVVGPCSLHNMEVATEYADKLKELAKEVNDKLFLVMRTYFEKPRTIKGWKGFLNDPYLDGTYLMQEGLEQARKFLLYCAENNIPTATEMLDLISPQYIADLVSWAAIGARTTESQSHRELASGLSMPVGFKNGTKGSIDIAVHAIKSAAIPHHFLSVDDNGVVSIFGTTGNPDCHLILRGGKDSTNYDSQSIREAAELMKSQDLHPSIMVDCSHGNSKKDYTKQAQVCREVIRQIDSKDSPIKGIMIESNLKPGNQKLEGRHNELDYGVSITDSCIGWEETEELLKEISNMS